MKQFFKHKGYYCEVYYSAEDESYIGRVLGIKSMLAVHEDTASETIRELIESIDDYLLVCTEEKRTPNSTDPAVALEIESLFENNPCNEMFITHTSQELAPAH